MTTWPHAPSRSVSHAGAYIVTAATYEKVHMFRAPERLRMLQSLLLETLQEHGWTVQQWAVFSNHYHFVASSPVQGPALAKTIGKIHSLSAREINRMDSTPGRQVWFRYWDTRLSYEASYLARLNYVRCNAVKHGLVRNPEDYEFCSAAWFRARADSVLFNTVANCRSDRVNVKDDF